MQKSFLILSAILTLVSCGLRVSNHLYIATKQNQVVDSVLILNNLEDINFTNPSNLICETEIIGPLQKNYDYIRLLEYAKNGARKQGGNVVKIIYYHGLFETKYLRCSLKVKTFYLDSNSLSTIKAQLDSTQKVYQDSIKDMSIIHIKDYDDQGERSVFFNDSLVANLKGPGFDSMRKRGQKDFVFDKEGVLKIDGIEKMKIEMGKEYYIVLYTTLNRHTFNYQYKFETKDVYENNPLY
jgi:hypothetical protein